MKNAARGDPGGIFIFGMVWVLACARMTYLMSVALKPSPRAGGAHPISIASFYFAFISATAVSASSFYMRCS
jgi:hypothetical protein